MSLLRSYIRETLQERTADHAFMMRQSKAARLVGMGRAAFVEKYGNIDYVPRQAPLPDDTVKGQLRQMRRAIQQSDMGPIKKRLAMWLYDKTFTPSTIRYMETYQDIIDAWDNLKSAFKQKAPLQEQWSINLGTIRGAMEASDEDREKRTNHPYNWAAEAFARARISRDWEQEPDHDEEEMDLEHERLKPESPEEMLKRYINATMVYDK